MGTHPIFIMKMTRNILTYIFALAFLTHGSGLVYALRPMAAAYRGIGTEEAKISHELPRIIEKANKRGLPGVKVSIRRQNFLYYMSDENGEGVLPWYQWAHLLPGFFLEKREGER